MSPGEEYEVLQQKPNSSIVINIMMLLYIEKTYLSLRCINNLFINQITLVSNQ
jgi:hypothetical protein